MLKPAAFVLVYSCSVITFSALAVEEASPGQLAQEARTEQIQDTLADIQQDTVNNLDVAQQNADAIDDNAATDASGVQADYSGENQ